MRRKMTPREEQLLGDELFLEACLEEIYEGQDIAIVAEPKTARRLRSCLKRKRRGYVRVVVGDPAAAAARCAK